MSELSQPAVHLPQRVLDLSQAELAQVSTVDWTARKAKAAKEASTAENAAATPAPAPTPAAAAQAQVAQPQTLLN